MDKYSRIKLLESRMNILEERLDRYEIDKNPVVKIPIMKKITANIKFVNGPANDIFPFLVL